MLPAVVHQLPVERVVVVQVGRVHVLLDEGIERLDHALRRRSRPSRPAPCSARRRRRSPRCAPATCAGKSSGNGLPIGLILIPVSSSHFGPEKLIGSSSWSAVFPDDVERGPASDRVLGRVDRRLRRVAGLLQHACAAADRRRRAGWARRCGRPRVASGQRYRARPGQPRLAAPAGARLALARTTRAASRCFGSIVGFESIRVAFQLLPTAAWVSDCPPRQRVGGGASRTAWSGSGLGRRAQGVESLPQRQLVDPEVAGIGHRPEPLLQAAPGRPPRRRP